MSSNFVDYLKDGDIHKNNGFQSCNLFERRLMSAILYKWSLR